MTTFLILFAIIGLLPFILLLKNQNTCVQQLKIMHAIWRYQEHWTNNYEYQFLVDIDDMEDYDKTLLRIFDWGYKNILPREKLELVKPFIKN